jgi:U32 family peptidase
VELLAPAGNLEKLRTAYAYGADAAYIGVRSFSLRSRADNFHGEEWKEAAALKKDRKLYGALNIYFRNEDLRQLEQELDYLTLYPFDAFIISDLGILPILRTRFPDIDLHLSTQANCMNVEAAGIYRDLGFTRIVPGREMSLHEIAEVKSRWPDLEIEAFVHGAMCMAYSGRCFLSSYLAGRSANEGDCSHTCRWKYRVTELPGTLALEEEKRPGELFPVIEGDSFTTILSSKDLCMIDHLQALREAGVDSLKIEGRMKSIYYAAVVTRAYRKALDALEAGASPQSWSFYRDELFSVSHREFSTGFFFDREQIQIPTDTSYLRTHMFLGSLGEQSPPGSGVYRLDVKNQLCTDVPIEFIGPDQPCIPDGEFVLYNGQMEPVIKADHGRPAYIRPSVPVEEGFIIRRRTDDALPC